MIRVIAVGIDPGITTGIAIIDLRGNLISLDSKRNFRRNDIIRYITKFGKAVIIACDVSPPPKSVEKICSILGCELYYPERSLSIEEKIELTKDYASKIRNDHEKDALAAVIKSWRNYKNLFYKVEETLKNLGYMEFFDLVLIKLLKEKSSNIEDAIEKVVEQKRKFEESNKIIKGMSLEDCQNIIADLKKKIKERDLRIQKITEEANSLNSTIKKLKEEINRLKSIKVDFENVERIREEMEFFREGIKLWKKFRILESKNLEPIIEFESIEGRKLEDVDRLVGLYKRTIFCKDDKNLNLLNSYNIKALIVPKPLGDKDLEKLEFPVILYEPEIIKIFDDTKVIQKNLLEEKIKEARKVGFVKWLEAYKKRKL